MTRKLPTRQDRERGARLRSARNLTLHATRSAFCAKHKFTIQTIQMWELGENAPSATQLQRFLDALEQEGVRCTREWLLHGVGDSPVQGAPSSSGSGQEDFSLEDQMEREAGLFVSLSARRGKQAIVVTVPDDHMSPDFAATDCVGGYELPGNQVDTLLGSTCLVKAKTKSSWQVGKLRKAGEHYVVTVNSVDCPPVVTKRVVSAAPIVWHRKAQ